MAGDSTLFAREDYVEEAWRIVEPVLKTNTPVYQYAPRDMGSRRSRARDSARRLEQSRTRRNHLRSQVRQPDEH